VAQEPEIKWSLEISRAEYPPYMVSQYLDIPGSALPRLTQNTIEKPTKVPAKRGAAGGYSKLDIALIGIGLKISPWGLLPHQIRSWLAEMRKWLLTIVDDPRLGQDDKKFIREHYMRFLIGKMVDGKLQVWLCNFDEFTPQLFNEGEPLLVMDLPAFLTREWESITEHMRQYKPEEFLSD